MIPLIQWNSIKTEQSSIIKKVLLYLYLCSTTLVISLNNSNNYLTCLFHLKLN